MSAGSAEDIRKAIRNCKAMETLKKFTYGLKKTKYMVFNTGREKEEVIEEEVKAGKVNKTEEYKYVGFNVDGKGNCQHHIRKKGKKIKGQVTAIKSIANYSNVGAAFVIVRLLLYVLCIIPSLLYAIEAWNKLTRKEIKMLEQQQAKALCQLMQLPRSTPYLGLLNEVGLCRIEEIIECRKAMLLQNILQSDDRRLCKRMILDQKEEQEDGTFYMETKKILGRYEVDIDEIADMTKSKLKDRLKTKMKEKMTEHINKAADQMKKLRFIQPGQFERQEYVKKLSGFACLETMKTRLNMLPVYGNFKADLTLERLCPYCKAEDDTTEHIIECTELGRTSLTVDDLQNTNNQQTWTMINERVKFNLEHRAK